MSTSDSARLQSIKEKVRGSEHGYYRDDDISTNRYSDVLLNNHIATRKSGRATRYTIMSVCSCERAMVNS
uniref:Uncharacterized protein n=1 Tax=Heterorhabditis bacteriophora TaxID=37862 RepID=A0A1I7XL59_HETBA